MLFLMLKDHLFFGTPAQPSSNLVSSNTCGISRRPIRYVRSARSHIVVGICIALERREFASSRDVVRIRMFRPSAIPLRKIISINRPFGPSVTWDSYRYG